MYMEYILLVVLSKQIICVSYKMNEKKNNIYTRKKIIIIIIINHQKLIKLRLFN
jgi:hypothetical protein